MRKHIMWPVYRHHGQLMQYLLQVRTLLISNVLGHQVLLTLKTTTPLPSTLNGLITTHSPRLSMQAVLPALPRYCSRNTWRCSVTQVWNHIILTAEQACLTLQPVRAPATAVV